MKNILNSEVKIIRICTTIAIVVFFVLAFLDIYQVYSESRKLSLLWIIFLLCLFLINALAASWGLLTLWYPKSVEGFDQVLIKLRGRLKFLHWILALMVAFIPVLMFLFAPLDTKLSGYGWRSTLFVICIAVIAALIAKTEEKLLSWQAVIKSMLLIGSLFAFAKISIGVTSHPFSLGWSEGNRIWDYSILYDRARYDYPLDQRIPAYIDIGRQSLWGLPFLVPGISIFYVRFWSALIFSLPYAVLGWMLFRPASEIRKHWLWVGLWTLVFLYQGPIYSPLVLSAILVAGVRRKPLWLALPVVFLAGYYAQISRLTWIFAPAMWSVMMTLGDNIHLENGRIPWRVWAKTVALGFAGLLGGVGLKGGWQFLQSIFAQIPKKTAQIAAQTDAIAVGKVGGIQVIDQPLLWERLWPNPTYGMGIVVAIIVAVGPLIVLLVYLASTKRWKLNFWQVASMFTILLIFLTVGIVASVKIGGGSNLHNLDMFLIGLVFTGVLAWEAGGHRLFMNLEERPFPVRILLSLIVAIPAFMPIIGAEPLTLPSQEATDWTLELLQTEIDRVIAEGTEVLFMDQRQLLTFGFIKNVPLVPEYEKKKVMDKAMSADDEYFAAFYQDLADHRFGLIVTDPQRVRFSEDDEAWGEENDTWVQWVSEPLLCYYQPKYTIKKTNVWLFTPREDISACSYP